MNDFNVDIHFDLLMLVEEERRKGRHNVIREDFLPSIREGGFRVIVSSLFIDDIFIPEMALRHALDQISSLYQEIEESDHELKLCKNYQDIESLKDHQIGIMLAFEGIEPLYNDINLLDIFYELGVRIVGMNWSRRNYAADGCFFNEQREGKKGGLTPFGVQIVERAEALGMIIDVSHLNDEGFWDVIKFSKKPVLATHSNSRSLTSVMRNLNDEQIRAIAEKDGLIGINSASSFVSDKDETSNITAYVNHIEKMKELVGIDYVALGFDFCDSSISDKFEPIKFNNGRTFFNVVRGHSDAQNVKKEMLERGFTKAETEKVFSENFLRLVKNHIK